MNGGGFGSVEERKLQQLGWLESLSELFLGILRAEGDLAYYREKYQLDAERIFQDIDSMRVGYFYMNRFSHWISVNCYFTLADEDLIYIQEGLNGGNSHCVHKEDFLKSVNSEVEVPEDEKAEESVVEAEEQE
jgi:hypothetical protein